MVCDTKEEREGKDLMISQGCHVFGVKQDTWDGFVEESTGMLAQDRAMDWAVDRIRNHEVHDCDPEGCEHTVDCSQPLTQETRTFIIVDEAIYHIDIDEVNDHDVFNGVDPECPGGENCVC